MSVSKLVNRELLSLGMRVRHGHCVGVLDVDGWSKLF